MSPGIEQLFFKLLNVIDFCNRDDRKFTKLAVNDYRLGISVADDADA